MPDDVTREQLEALLAELAGDPVYIDAERALKTFLDTARDSPTREVLRQCIEALDHLATSAEKANDYSTRNEHFNLPQVATGYIDEAHAALTAAKALLGAPEEGA